MSLIKLNHCSVFTTPSNHTLSNRVSICILPVTFSSAFWPPHFHPPSQRSIFALSGPRATSQPSPDQAAEAKAATAPASLSSKTTALPSTARHTPPITLLATTPATDANLLLAEIAGPKSASSIASPRSLVTPNHVRSRTRMETVLVLGRARLTQPSSALLSRKTLRVLLSSIPMTMRIARRMRTTTWVLDLVSYHRPSSGIVRQQRPY